MSDQKLISGLKASSHFLRMFRLVLCVLIVHEVVATCCVGATVGLNCCVHPGGCCRADYRHECCDGGATVVGGGFVAENSDRNYVGGGVVGGGFGELHIQLHNKVMQHRGPRS